MATPLAFVCSQCGGLNRVRPDKVDAGPKCGRCSTPLPTAGAPVHVDDDGLDRLVRSSPVPVLVDFHADWCGPCKALAPTLDTLARDHAGRLVVAKVDTEQHQRNAARHGVRGIPSVHLFVDGQHVDEAAGLRQRAAYEQMLAPHLHAAA